MIVAIETTPENIILAPDKGGAPAAGDMDGAFSFVVVMPATEFGAAAVVSLLDPAPAPAAGAGAGL